MFLPWLTLFDFANVRANFKTPIDLYGVKTRSDNYALLVPIFNDLKYLTNIDFLKTQAEHVVLCTTNHETPEFVSRLEALAAEHGFRVSYSEVESGGKNPWAIYHKTLLAHDSVLKRTINYLQEKYVIFIDGDTYVDGDLSVLCGAMDEQNWDIASVRVLPSNRSNWIEQLQGVEYDIAMRSRLLYPWLTSGAGMVARTDVMISIMENHSLFFNGGDVEIGKLADMMGYKVGHIPMVFYTDIPNTFGKWVRQRRSWMCGMFRHSVMNWDHNIKHPFHFLYFTLIIYGLYPFKLAEMIQHIHLMPLILALYAITTYLANWKVRSRWMLIFPLYALFQVLVIIWLGIYRYLVTVRRTGNWGRIRVRHNPIAAHSTRHKLWAASKDLGFISLTSAAILLGTIEPVQRWLFGKTIDAGVLVVNAGQTIREGFAASLQTVHEWSAQLPATVILPASALLILVAFLAILYFPDVLTSLVSRPVPVLKRTISSRKLARALTRVNRAIELEPHSANLFYQRGQLLARRGLYQDSLADYSRAIDLHLATLGPDQRPSQQSYNLDNYKHVFTSQSGIVDPACEFLAQLYRDRGDIYYERFQIADALVDTLSALNLSPSMGDLYRLRTLRRALKNGTHSDIQPAIVA